MSADLVTVTYTGPFTAELPDGRTVAPGDRIDIPAAQAEGAWFSRPHQVSEKAQREAARHAPVTAPVDPIEDGQG